MKVIKTPAVYLENKRLRFFQIGLIVSCSLVLLAFRWTTYEFEEQKEYIPKIPMENIEVELPPFSFQEPAAAQAAKKIITISASFEIVDELPTEKKGELEFISIDEIIGDIGEGYEDEGIIDPEIPLGTSNWMKAERTPYFDECAQPSDRETESLCTYTKIKNFVQRNTDYPSSCREMDIQGTVWLTFVIDKNGDVTGVEAIKSPHQMLTDAAMEGLSKLPKMNPGTQRLQPVDVRLEIPVRFMLK